MQRFVTYIYTYEDEQKKYNSGYAKIETRGNSGRIEIHLDNNDTGGGEAKVYFLAVYEDKLEEVHLGVLKLENGRGMGVFTFRTETISNTKLTFEEMAGIKIEDANGQRHMSFWKDVKLPEPEVGPEVEPKVESEVEPEVLHSMEISMRNVFPDYTMEDIWKNLEKNRSGVQLKDDIYALKIELSDLRELPKKYWYLGNNSFLLHGFFNYHHLLLGKMPDGRWFLGVPGVYERQERIMASFFGFAEYLPEGVWYHILEE